MNDPYKVLGVSPNATDDEIKKAYRDLARKYHPDKYRDSDLADLAEEKMKEVNAAYEEIKTLRERGATGTGGYSGGYSGGYRGTYGRSTSSNPKFNEIRRLINADNVAEAEKLLGTFVEADRGAEWHFLLGCIRLRKGEYVDAQREFDTAYRMEPTNNEYFRFKEAMRRRSDQFGGGYRTTSGDGCSLCTTLLCADCCCECMGGDLIPCC